MTNKESCCLLLQHDRSFFCDSGFNIPSFPYTQMLELPSPMLCLWAVAVALSEVNGAEETKQVFAYDMKLLLFAGYSSYRLVTDILIHRFHI